MSTSTNRQPKTNSKLAKFANIVVPVDKNAPTIRDIGGSLRHREDIANEQLKTVTPLPGTELIKVRLDEIEDAPEDWDFFGVQSDDHIMNLAVSLLNEGQLSPIIVRGYKSPDNPKIKWQGLAGRTRRSAAQYLVEEGYAEWQEVYAFAYPDGKCADIDARRIIVHSNTEQRISMPPEVKLKCFLFDYLDEQNADRNQSAAVLTEKLMTKYSIKKSQAYNFRLMGKKLIPNFLKMIQEGKLSTRNALHLTKVDKNLQEYIYDNYKDKLEGKNFKDFIGKKKEQLDKLFAIINTDGGVSSNLKIVDESDKDITFTVKISKKAEESFRKSMHRIYTKYGIPFQQ